jgi:hypothetical protein
MHSKLRYLSNDFSQTRKSALKQFNLVNKYILIPNKPTTTIKHIKNGYKFLFNFKEIFDFTCKKVKPFRKMGVIIDDLLDSQRSYLF